MSGASSPISSPGPETRDRHLRKKAESENIQVDDEILTYIATRSNQYPELEGALTRLLAYCP